MLGMSGWSLLASLFDHYHLAVAWVIPAVSLEQVMFPKEDSSSF